MFGCRRTQLHDSDELYLDQRVGEIVVDDSREADPSGRLTSLFDAIDMYNCGRSVEQRHQPVPSP